MAEVTTRAQLNYERIYAYRFRGVDPNAKQAAWRIIGNYLYERLGCPQAVLDPAAGSCEFVNAIPARDVWAVDLAANLKMAAQPHVKAVQADIFSAQLPADYFDAAFVSNFLEHLNSHESVSAFLAVMHRALKPGGKLLIMGPNFKYCYREYFDCADHKLALTDVAVCEHLFGAGFEVDKAYPKFLPFSFRSKLPPNPIFLRTYLHFPLAWNLFGKQFLIFARRAS